MEYHARWVRVGTVVRASITPYGGYNRFQQGVYAYCAIDPLDTRDEWTPRGSNASADCQAIVT
ncbi:MAG TPA: hypothetical protein VMT30_07865 [Candidatus Saccharimonadia bacterium]|nr:hypothetical protein [Candidatus Saccharimonadia bacterium]